SSASTVWSGTWWAASCRSACGMPNTAGPSPRAPPPRPTARSSYPFPQRMGERVGRGSRSYPPPADMKGLFFAVVVLLVYTSVEGVVINLSYPNKLAFVYKDIYLVFVYLVF